eukprot:159512-Amphidinium_carterae.5
MGTCRQVCNTSSSVDRASFFRPNTKNSRQDVSFATDGSSSCQLPGRLVRLMTIRLSAGGVVSMLAARHQG